MGFVRRSKYVRPLEAVWPGEETAPVTIFAGVGLVGVGRISLPEVDKPAVVAQLAQGMAPAIDAPAVQTTVS